MKISESEIILIVVLVLIGFVLYTSRTMKTTSIKKVGGKHTKLGAMCNFDADCDKYYPGYAGVECFNGRCLPGGFNPYR